MKTTKDLINEIKKNYNIEAFLAENADELYDPVLREYIRTLMREKGLNRADVIRDGLLNQNYAYQIFSGLKKPSRDKVIQLAFGLRLNLDEASRLLKIAGVGDLYPRCRRDAVIMYGIEHRLTIMNVNDILYEMEEYVFD